MKIIIYKDLDTNKDCYIENITQSGHIVVRVYEENSKLTPSETVGDFPKGLFQERFTPVGTAFLLSTRYYNWR